jgi:hypothetical protein
LESRHGFGGNRFGCDGYGTDGRVVFGGRIRLRRRTLVESYQA